MPIAIKHEDNVISRPRCDRSAIDRNEVSTYRKSYPARLRKPRNLFDGYSWLTGKWKLHDNNRNSMGKAKPRCSSCCSLAKRMSSVFFLRRARDMLDPPFRFFFFLFLRRGPECAPRLETPS